MNKSKISKKVIAATTALAIIGSVFTGVVTGAFARDAVEETGAVIKTLFDVETTEGCSTYIGRGYNIIDKNYINASDVQKELIFNIGFEENNNIWNEDVMMDYKIRNIETYEISSKKISSFMNKWLSKISGGIGIQPGWCGFTQISPKIALGVQGETSKYKENEYIMHVRQIETAYVNWLLEEEEYASYLTERFKKDVMTMEPMALFKKYGTHVLTGVKMGGRVEIKTQLSSNNQTALNEAKAKLGVEVAGIFNTNDYNTWKAAKEQEEKDRKEKEEQEKKDKNVQSQLEDTGAGTNPTATPTQTPTLKSDIDLGEGTDKGIGYEGNYISNKEDKEVLQTTYTTCYGGTPLDMTTLDNVKKNYPEWITKVADAPAIVGVLGEESLYPIWKLVGCMADADLSISREVAEARMKELEDAFNAYGLENYNKLIADEIETDENKKQVEELDIKPIGVKVNKEFNKNKKVSDKVQAIHEGWDLGKVMLVNAKKNMDGTYTYNEGRDLQIRFRLDQNLEKLPVGNTKNFSHKIVYNGITSGKVADYGNVLGNHYIKGLGKGCYFVQVTYNNQKVETLNAIDFLNKMNKNDTITMLDTSTLPVEENDGIDKIVIFVTYQTSAWNLVTNPVQDWVVETELNFE